MFFNAYIDAQLDERVRAEFALLAACSYYLADLPGNARLLVSRIAEMPSAQGAHGLDWLTFKLLRSSFDLTDTERNQMPHLVPRFARCNSTRAREVAPSRCLK